MASQGHCFRLKPKVHKQLLVSLVKVHGVEVQDEHLIPTPNRWTNQKSELGYLTILKELCGNGSIRLGGLFGVDQVLLQQFKALDNKGHPFSNGDGQATNYAYNLGSTWATPSDANEEVLMVTQLDEERRHLWEMAKANLEKAHK
jgi:hypothetical protein